MKCIRSLVILMSSGNLEYTKKALSLLKENTTWDPENRLVIYDTPSTPESREYLSKITWADVFLTAQCDDYIASWNMMFKRINAQYYITFHNDIIDIPKNWRENLIKEAEKDPKIAVVTALDPSAHPQVGEIDWVITGCTLYKRDIFEKIGLFDEEFDKHFDAEDKEIGWRTKAFGYRIIVAPVEIGHMQHGIRIYRWNGDHLAERKIELTKFLKERGVKRDDIEYLCPLPLESGLVKEEEKINEFYPFEWNPSKKQFLNKIHGLEWKEPLTLRLTVQCLSCKDSREYIWEQQNTLKCKKCNAIFTLGE